MSGERSSVHGSRSYLTLCRSHSMPFAVRRASSATPGLRHRLIRESYTHAKLRCIEATRSVAANLPNEHTSADELIGRPPVRPLLSGTAADIRWVAHHLGTGVRYPTSVAIKPVPPAGHVMLPESAYMGWIAKLSPSTWKSIA